MHGLKDLSRQILFADESFKTGKFPLKTAQVSAAVGEKIDQGPDQEITFRPERFPSPSYGMR